MKTTVPFLIVAILMYLVSCTPDREFAPPPPAEPVGGSNNILEGTLRINEFMASGSTFPNELDSSGTDWVEIYNTTGDTINLNEGRWFLTDSLGNPTLFDLPEASILPYGFLVVWCDSQDTTITQIHSNFGLSKNGEEIGLTHKRDDDTYFFVDQIAYLTQSSGISMARFPDGTINWIFTSSPTPNDLNQE
jgi:Lamin Tail Domain